MGKCDPERPHPLTSLLPWYLITVATGVIHTWALWYYRQSVADWVRLGAGAPPVFAILWGIYLCGARSSSVRGRSNRGQIPK